MEMSLFSAHYRILFFKTESDFLMSNRKKIKFNPLKSSGITSDEFILMFEHEVFGDPKSIHASNIKIEFNQKHPKKWTE